jgi:hypothetical protein
MFISRGYNRKNTFPGKKEGGKEKKSTYYLLICEKEENKD